ncbi:MAG TPA: hypothetical protein VFA97_00805 [Gaiellaceae bacterium]|nr:hypothetical protein [Gaiellaceae bacterium]
MPENTQRYIGGVLGFALAIVWIVAGLGSAIVCLAAATIGFGLALARQRVDWRRVIGGIVTTRSRLETSAAARAQRVAKPRKPQHARHAPPRPARRREVQRPRTPLAADPASYGW